jgi:hypothetical protein
MAKKKTKKKVAKKPVNHTTVKNCNFTGVQYDAKAVDAIETISQALLVNAQALYRLAGVFNAQGIEIECLLKVG